MTDQAYCKVVLALGFEAQLIGIAHQLIKGRQGTALSCISIYAEKGTKMKKVDDQHMKVNGSMINIIFMTRG